VNDVVVRGGYTILRHYYDDCLTKALIGIYPEIPDWRFGQVLSGFWYDTKNHQKFLDWLAAELNIRDMDDWYKVTTLDVIRRGGQVDI
jgi:hypothetical protein